MASVRFDHINIAARNVEQLAEFYEKAFGCTRLSSSNDLSGEKFARGMGLREAKTRGVWLRLPDSGGNGPELEIFEYQDLLEQSETVVNRQGINHIAFDVSDVNSVAERLVSEGGSYLGEVVDFEAPSGNKVIFVFMRDPEGNIIELINYNK